MQLFRALARFLPLLVLTCASAATEFLTYDNTPLGTPAKPLLLRTFMPDPGLGEEVFANHGKGANSPKYSPKSGQDVKGEYKPVQGIPAAIGVNHGAALSYCFDTTECRLLYAWQGGFLDMYPYWGDSGRGNRQSFNYVPHLVGNLFYKTNGSHPLSVDGKSLSEMGAPTFLGYRLEDGIPRFEFKVADRRFTAKITPATASLTFHAEFTVDPPAPLGYRLEVPKLSVSTSKEGTLQVVIQHESIATYQGFPRDMKIKVASPEAGQKLYMAFGCVACHSTDGAKGHGPTFAGLYGAKRELEGAPAVTADDAYLLESIKDPNARTAKGFPPNYMPPYMLKDVEYESLLLFLKSINQPG